MKVPGMTVALVDDIMGVVRRKDGKAKIEDFIHLGSDVIAVMMTALGNNWLGFHVERSMSESMRMNLNLKFEQLAVRIETQLGSKVETSIANKMGNISATLSSLKNTMSNLEKKIEPNEKSGIRVSPEEKLEIRLQKVNASLESVLSRKEEEDRKTMDEVGRLREDVTKWENELERDPGDRIALRYRDISVKIYTKRKEAHEKNDEGTG
jgi:hypothetical protein